MSLEQTQWSRTLLKSRWSCVAAQSRPAICRSSSVHHADSLIDYSGLRTALAPRGQCLAPDIDFDFKSHSARFTFNAESAAFGARLCSSGHRLAAERPPRRGGSVLGKSRLCTDLMLMGEVEEFLEERPVAEALKKSRAARVVRPEVERALRRPKFNVPFTSECSTACECVPSRSVKGRVH